MLTTGCCPCRHYFQHMNHLSLNECGKRFPSDQPYPKLPKSGPYQPCRRWPCGKKFSSIRRTPRLKNFRMIVIFRSYRMPWSGADPKHLRRDHQPEETDPSFAAVWICGINLTGKKRLTFFWLSQGHHIARAFKGIEFNPTGRFHDEGDFYPLFIG